MDASVRTVQLHGRPLAYRRLGREGDPAVLFVHGLGSSGETWGAVPERVAGAGFDVVVVDLPGHGASYRGPGDYSLGAMASALRDLLDHLAVDRVHVVGHSLGGGVALQFAYQFPERAGSLVLESSGGLGVETFGGLRAAALPGADLVIRLAFSERAMTAADWVGRQLGRVGIRPHALSPRALDTVRGLSDEASRASFLATLRSVIGPQGQYVSALDKLHLVGDRPVLIVWGDRDPMLPVEHGAAAHALLPHSRFVVFEGVRHEPHVDQPDRFAELVVDHLLGAESSLADAG